MEVDKMDLPIKYNKPIRDGIKYSEEWDETGEMKSSEGEESEIEKSGVEENEIDMGEINQNEAEKSDHFEDCE